MAFTITITKTTAGLESAYTKNESYVAGAKEAISEAIPTGVNDTLVNFSFNPLSGRVFAIGASTDYKVTVKTNSSTSPDNVFIMDTQNPFLFTAVTGSDGSIISWGGYDSNGDELQTIDRLYATNTGLSECMLTVDSLFDPTP
jgi:hypothetical protein